MPEIIKHGEVGFLCSTAEEYVRAIEEVGRIRLSKYRRACGRKFDRIRVTKDYKEVYEGLLESDAF